MEKTVFALCDAAEVEKCRIECYGKNATGDAVLLTDRRLYCHKTTLAAGRVRKAVALDSVNSVESGREGMLRYLLIGIGVFVLCCLLSALLTQFGWVATVSTLAAGFGFFVVCLVLYFSLKITYIRIAYRGGVIRLASPGLTEEELVGFRAEVLKARDALLVAEYKV